MNDLDVYRPLVRSIARKYFMPGAEPDDLEQEGMIGLLNALRDYRPDRGMSLRSFVGLCVERQVITAVKTATRMKHGPLNAAVSADKPGAGEEGDLTLLGMLPSPGADPADIVPAREEALELLRLIADELSPLERRALIGFVNGETYREIAADVGGDTRYPDGSPRHKRVENALIRARLKLGLVPPTQLQAA